MFKGYIFKFPVARAVYNNLTFLVLPSDGTNSLRYFVHQKKKLCFSLFLVVSEYFLLNDET